MTNEQWLIYLYSIYPDGGYQAFYVCMFLLSIGFYIVIHMSYNGIISKTYHPERDEKFTVESKKEYLENTLWHKTKKYRFVVLIFFLFLASICNFIPSKNAFIYIIATPYVVDGTKSVIESLQDPTSKAYKLNQLLDKGLDKAIKELDKPQTKDNNDK